MRLARVRESCALTGLPRKRDMPLVTPGSVYQATVIVTRTQTRCACESRIMLTETCEPALACNQPRVSIDRTTDSDPVRTAVGCPEGMNSNALSQINDAQGRLG